MKITWLGHASFLVESGGEKLVTDPYDKIGLEFPSVTADVVTTSHDHFDHSATGLVGGSPKVLSETGEHAEGVFRVEGYPTYHDESQGSQRGGNTVYIIEAEGVRVCHLGDLGHRLSPEDVASFGRVDVLMVPVGGVYTVDAAGAESVSASVGPKIVLPMHYKIPGLSLEIGGVEEFSKRFAKVREADVLDIAGGELPGETEVVILQRKS
jgi:L-ascorbate metabolism protein UlaG (beta-lactamase superfamily)